MYNRNYKNNNKKIKTTKSNKDGKRIQQENCNAKSIEHANAKYIMQKMLKADSIQSEVQTQVKNEIPVFANVSTHVPAHINISSNHKLLSYLFLTSLLLSSVTTAHAQNIQATTDESPQQLTLQRINVTCSNPPFIAGNKPAHIRFALQDGNRIPVSCVTNSNSVQCYKEKDDMRVYYQNYVTNPKITEERENAREKLSVLSDAKKVIDKVQFTPAQRKIFNDYVHILESMEATHHLSKYPKRIGAGNCAEHAAYNAKKIFDINKEENTENKVQEIYVQNSKNNDAHVYVCVDCDAEDVIINENLAKTEAYLQSVKDGYICDSWNKGLFSKVANNVNSFYRTGWDSVTAKTLNMEFNVSDLPKKAQAYIEKQLIRFNMGHKLVKNPQYKVEL